jgi:protein involved in polysaccharide export with SLBB domain
MVLNISVYAQASDANALDESESNNDRNVMLARSSTDYRVTPGDVYTLAYVAGTTPVSYVITVDASYRIRVSNLGLVNGAGKTFMQLKSEAETIVANNYPLSGVQMVLVQPAVFRVYVTGEVHTSGEVSAWGLTRLSSLLEDNNLTSYASIRDISIKSSSGETKVYDLFKAQRLGDFSQDPYLRPGDVINFNRITRVVNISGEVERPGRYQLLDGENLKDLVEFYGNGLTDVSDSSRIEIVRLVNSKNLAGDKLFLGEQDLGGNFALENHDAVTISAITQLNPVLFVEGAVASADELVAANRLSVRFVSGEFYVSLIRDHANWFSSVSDLQNAYILRKGERIPINLNTLLYDVSFDDKECELVEDNDILIVPFRQYFVTVSGAVINPGRYPYIPDRNWEYYIGLAGGFLPEKNGGDVVTITGSQGEEMSKTSEITPETTITATTNRFLFYFKEYAPVLTTLASVATTIISIILMTTN